MTKNYYAIWPSQCPRFDKKDEEKYYARVIETARKKRDPVEFILDARDNV